uniref:Uncharacterized protein n=1 Tax=Kwoniella pini CBS 10737 TaxID=1296096 RepID=A0A1B9HSB5_9TREE|nr:uncharacterized protein I206_07912 [Kwoniella pini CBS 10737]OCF46127.1 hypothetical protein I206_07912 [Kwoniella pini CBS 10737]
MNTFISASSPLFRYQPCKSCEVTQGFQSGSDFSGRDYNGTESGMITRTAGTSVSMNCTGTGISFDISYSSPNNSSFKPFLRINGSSPSTSQNATSTSIRGLPLAQHTFELDILSSHDSSDTNNNTVPNDWIRINGATCNLGYAINSQTKNETIDDTAWRDWKIYLTPGWNMLEKDVSNYIDLDQYQAELPTSSRNYNNSISWTEQSNAANQIFFAASAVWVYGIVGDQAGSFEVILDNTAQGVFDGSGGPRVTPLTNTLPSSPPSPSASQTMSSVEVSSYYPSSTAPAAEQLGLPTSLSGEAIAGIVVAASIVLIAFMITWIFACLRKRKEHKINQETESRRSEGLDNEKAQTTFFRFSSRASSPNRPHPFHPLPSPKNLLQEPQATIQSSIPQQQNNTNSFLKINNSRFSRSTNNQQSEIISDLPTTSENDLGHIPKKSISGLNISNPQPITIQRKNSEDYLPSLSSASSQIQPLNPKKSSEKLNPKHKHKHEHEHELTTAPVESRINTSQLLHNNRFETNQSDSNVESIRRETKPPLVAALSGKTSSPLTELSKSTFISKKNSKPFNFEEKNYFGRKSKQSLNNERKSISNSLKTVKTNYTNYTDEENGILSMYAKFPTGIERQSKRNTQFQFQENEQQQQREEDNLSGVGVALGSPMQDNNFQWTNNEPVPQNSNNDITKFNRNNNDNEEEEEEEFKPPTRRFFGLGDRPKSGVSNKSGKTVSSVGSGWRYM